MDEAAISLRRSLIGYERYQQLGTPPLPASTGSLEAFSLMPDGRLDVDSRVMQLIERGEELEVGPAEYKRRREQRERARRHLDELRGHKQSDQSDGAV